MFKIIGLPTATIPVATNTIVKLSYIVTTSLSQAPARIRRAPRTRVKRKPSLLSAWITRKLQGIKAAGKTKTQPFTSNSGAPYISARIIDTVAKPYYINTAEKRDKQKNKRKSHL